jgi:neuropeptide Y receptor
MHSRCLLAVPFTPLSFFSENWIFGKFLCHLVPFSLGVCVYVSTLTSLAIAIDRYFVIVHPFKPRMKLGVCILLIGVIWVVAVSISLPLAIYSKYDNTNHTIENNQTVIITTCKV